MLLRRGMISGKGENIKVWKPQHTNAKTPITTTTTILLMVIEWGIVGNCIKGLI
jgi:hypothetical protein